MTARAGKGRYQVEFAKEVGLTWAAFEHELDSQGIPIALPHRAAWASARAPLGHWWIGVRDPDGRIVGGFAAELRRSRILPGHHLIRVESLNPSLPDDAFEAALVRLIVEARRSHRSLWLQVEMISRQDDARAAAGAVLGRLGFRRLAKPRNYDRTPVLDLESDEQSILRKCSRRVRRHLKDVGTLPVRVEPLTDARWASRMQVLLDEAINRTGGALQQVDFVAYLQLAREHPELVRVMGMFHNDRQGDEALLAFAGGCFHGDHASYDLAASTRHVERGIPMLYPLLWDLICWGRKCGATWFDFGGITDGKHGDQDPLGGISDFKRSFTEQIVGVGEDWELDLAPVRSRLVRWVSKVSRATLTHDVATAVRRVLRVARSE